MKINACLSLIACLFGEDTNERFCEEEKMCSKPSSKVKFFHVCTKRRVNVMLNSGSTIEIGKTHSCKTIQRAHEFVPKANLLNRDGTGVFGFFSNKTNDIVRVEILNENDIIRAINTLAPVWDAAH